MLELTALLACVRGCVIRAVDGTSVFGISFFVCLVFLGPFFIVNLFLAVLKIKFADSKNNGKDDSKKAIEGMEGAKRLDPTLGPQLHPAAAKEAMLASDPAEEDAKARSEQRSLRSMFSRTKSVKEQETFEELLAKRPRWARATHWFVAHPNFNTFFLLAIGFNTACLSLERFDMSDSLSNFLEMSNLVLTLLFLLELVLKMVGLTPRHYFRDSFNCFDFVIVMISLVRPRLPVL
jgi:hypothetical protein